MLRIFAVLAPALSLPVGASGQEAPAPKTGFDVATWTSLKVKAPAFVDAGLELNAARTRETAEEITVYGKRRTLQENAALQPAPVMIGPATATGEQVHEGGFSGLRMTVAIPLGGIPGLDAVASLSAGHNQVNTTTTTSSAAGLLGLRLKF